eukprot:6189129-Pleurochrysis_carterae.AAC.1
MMYNWSHPVALPPSDGRDYASLSQNDVNFANHNPFPGHEPTSMQEVDPNHLAHQQPYVVKGLPGFYPNHQITSSEVRNSRSSGCRARCAARFWLLKVVITSAIDGRSFEGWSRLRCHNYRPFPI